MLQNVVIVVASVATSPCLKLFSPLLREGISLPPSQCFVSFSLLQIKRLRSAEKQVQMRQVYQKEVAYRSTAQMLNKFRDTFAVSATPNPNPNPEP